KRENQTAIQQKIFSDPHRQLPILKMDPVPMDQHGPAPTTLYAQTSARTGADTHAPPIARMAAAAGMERPIT
ncbi:MAG: hypothetical protein AAF566_14425, partial [Pseudomonadota bacterium]